jgi:hypothetical protein
VSNRDADLPSKKAQALSARSPKKRPASKGLKKRAGGNHGNGARSQFRPGQNSHTGEIFRRGPDTIPRGSGLLMMKVIAADKRQMIYEQLERFVSTPRGAFEFIKDFADRTDGRPTQKHEVSAPRTTIFQKDPTPAPPPPVFGPEGSPAPAPNGVLMDENGQTFVAIRERM